MSQQTLNIPNMAGRCPQHHGAQVFLVGGAVRDFYSGEPVRDKDFVVVGATAALMVDLGFAQVGRDFSVFLHPQTREEFSLAQSRASDKCSAHAGIEDDLARRDLTINAMAMDFNGKLVDPFGGLADLRAQCLRHVHPEAFTADPVRVLRLARFMARWPAFQVHAETKVLAAQVVASAGFRSMTPERVWKELSRGLMEAAPGRMITFLREIGALAVLLPELDRLWGVPQSAQHHPEVDTGAHVLLALEQAAKHGADLSVRFAVLLHDLGKGVTPQELLPAHHGHENAGVPLVTAVCDRLKVPGAVRDVALKVCKYHTNVHGVRAARHSTVVKLILKLGGLRQPQIMEQVIQACQFDAQGREGLSTLPYPPGDYLRYARRLTAAVDVSGIVANNSRPELLAQKIHNARVHAIAYLTRVSQGTR